MDLSTCIGCIRRMNQGRVRALRSAFWLRDRINPIKKRQIVPAGLIRFCRSGGLSGGDSVLCFRPLGMFALFGMHSFIWHAQHALLLTLSPKTLMVGCLVVFAFLDQCFGGEGTSGGG